MGEFTISPKALADLEDIYEYGLDRYGIERADRYQGEMFRSFQLLADFPGIAGQPITVQRQDVFRFPFGSHVIIFTTTRTGIRVARVFHESSVWQRRLQRGRLQM